VRRWWPKTPDPLPKPDLWNPMKIHPSRPPDQSRGARRWRGWWWPALGWPCSRLAALGSWRRVRCGRLSSFRKMTIPTLVLNRGMSDPLSSDAPFSGICYYSFSFPGRVRMKIKMMGKRDGSGGLHRALRRTDSRSESCRKKDHSPSANPSSMPFPGSPILQPKRPNRRCGQNPTLDFAR
jgi:hypothetical protein